MSPAEDRIYAETEFRTSVEDNAWYARSGTDSSGRYVLIDVGYSRKIELLTDALLLEQRYSREVLVPYIRYVAASVAKNNQFIDAPFAFIGMNSAAIQAYDEDRTAQQNLRAAVLNSMAFVLAHEVAHHVLGHYDKSFPNDQAGLRQLELQADAWALQRCVQAHFSPLGGLIPLMFDYVTTPLQLQGSRERNHPADVARMRAMFAAMRNALPSFRSDIEKSGGSYNDFRTFIDKTLTQLEAEMTIASGAPPGSPVDQGGIGEFRTALLSVIADGTRLSRYKGKADPDSSGEGWMSTIQIPGTTECEVWLPRDHSTNYLTCDGIRTPDLSQATKQYEQLVATVRAALEATWKRSDLSPSRITRAITTFGRGDREPTVHVTLEQHRGSARLGLPVTYSAEVTVFAPDRE
jgi:hypothetical protein